MSSIFKCERCGCCDSINATQTTSAGYLCAECKDGEWHGQFPKEPYRFEDHGPALNVPDPTSGDTVSFG